MPLGASITYGLASSEGNGYRKALRDMLVNPPGLNQGGHSTQSGNKVNMVGSRQAGTMKDNDVEGWSGFRVEEVHQKAMADESAPKYKPNVVLINAGTNDAMQNFNVSTAGERMEAMLRDLWSVSPRALIVLSTLLVNQDEAAERNVLTINSQYRALIDRLRHKERRRIVLAEMHNSNGPTLADLVDGIHPNDDGYIKMAKIWYDSLRLASSKGLLAPPEDVPGLPDDGEAEQQGVAGLDEEAEDY
ncbi:hypothetical protein VTH82DRAFT_4708 [Thermothelomyces myriococcoides]